MLEILTTFLVTSSASLLVHSYWTPVIMPNRLIKVMSYDVETHESPISIRLSGCCYLGDELVECSALGLGEGFGWVYRFIPERDASLDDMV